MNMAENRTKGQIEAEISEAIIKFEKEYMGRGHDENKCASQVPMGPP